MSVESTRQTVAEARREIADAFWAYLALAYRLPTAKESDVPVSMSVAVHRFEEAVRADARRDLETALRGLIESIGGCSCIPAYADRGLADPSCIYHELAVEVEDARAAVGESIEAVGRGSDA